ncbi:uncharacterized protein LOC113751442 [Coffea eugenioides]|uniref:uncharacterized protein LOC113751442 n=1 Tax=Coffea eugenioides TaxID=49369 RepID=UPI000F60792E|nr:uncharacterized protein LOC113751442 [Coffea eugenioides]
MEQKIRVIKRNVKFPMKGPSVTSCGVALKILKHGQSVQEEQAGSLDPGLLLRYGLHQITRRGYVASILSFNENMEREVKFFTETEENNQMRGPRTGVPHFL